MHLPFLLVFSDGTSPKFCYMMLYYILPRASKTQKNVGAVDDYDDDDDDDDDDPNETC